jgi:hypothetical protein
MSGHRSPHARHVVCKLSPADAEALARMVREHGHDGAAARLRVSPALLNKLVDGGSAQVDSVRRMTEALLNVRPRTGSEVP